MTDQPDGDRIVQLLGQIETLPAEDREAFIAGLSEADRSAVWDAELDESEQAAPVDYEDLGAGD
jgi:hypothetical protein